jgi:cell division control protein 24
MASSSGARKKSIISSQNLHIDTPVNTLLNKAASQSTSLYQQCSALRSRLLRIRGFQTYFDRAQTDDPNPVTQLWDLFTLGISLCYVFDQLPSSFPKINNNSFKQDKYEASPDREKKHAIALFAMQVRNKEVMSKIPGLEPFAITDLWDRKSTDGLVKVSTLGTGGNSCADARIRSSTVSQLSSSISQRMYSNARRHPHLPPSPPTARLIPYSTTPLFPVRPLPR